MSATQKTWTENDGTEFAECAVCGERCSTHDDATNPMAICGDCNAKCCSSCCDETSATRCKTCQQRKAASRVAIVAPKLQTCTGCCEDDVVLYDGVVETIANFDTLDVRFCIACWDIIRAGGHSHYDFKRCDAPLDERSGDAADTSNALAAVDTRIDADVDTSADTSANTNTNTTTYPNASSAMYTHVATLGDARVTMFGSVDSTNGASSVTLKYDDGSADVLLLDPTIEELDAMIVCLQKMRWATKKWANGGTK